MERQPKQTRRERPVADWPTVVACASDVTGPFSGCIFSTMHQERAFINARLFPLNGPRLFRDAESSPTCRKSVRLGMIRASGSARPWKHRGARPSRTPTILRRSLRTHVRTRLRCPILSFGSLRRSRLSFFHLSWRFSAFPAGLNYRVEIIESESGLGISS